MQNTKITTLFLDIGGVMLSNGWGHEFRHLAAEKFHLDRAEMDKRHKMVFAVYEEGRITLHDYLNRLVFYEKRDFTFEEFRDYMYSLSTPHDDMIAFVKRLKKQYNLNVIAVSNEGKELNTYRIKKFQLGKIYDFFVSSSYVGIRKPDLRIVKLAFDMAQVPKDEVIYIDDVQMFADVATDFGIKSICHQDCAATAKILAEYGLIL